jgi:3-hydroxy-9,10-secoandrosta-1,3,5(10)-triene-9,17-dione monooxygenase reductase component
MPTALAMAAPAPQARVDERSLRAAFGSFATGVAFVTASVDGTPLGLIVSTFTAVSLDPPLVSFCPARDSFTWRRMRHAGAVAINVLGEQHAGFARRAAEPGADRFAEPLHDPLAVIECDLEAEHAAGDHSIVVARVRSLAVASRSHPLVYFAGAFGAFHPEEIPCPQT